MKNEFMDQEMTSIEDELASLKPVAMSEDFLSRLDDAMVASAAEVEASTGEVIVATSDPELAELEESLRCLSPNGMPDDLIARLDSAMQRWHEAVPVEEKVIALHPQEKSSGNWLGFRSVAAVGVLGALSALMWNGSSQGEAVAESPRIPVLTNGAVTPVQFVSRDARASVISTNDHGVIWTKGGQPLRCIEVEVNNSLEFVNENGDRLILEEPKREVRFVPAKFN